MSNKNSGMQYTYKGLQDANVDKEEVQLIETINNILNHEKDTKDINRKTKLSDNYSMPTMDSIADYLELKYKNDCDVPVKIIRTWSKAHKDTSTSVGGWLIINILDTFKGFVEMIKQRSFGERLTGRGKEDNVK
jgi:hypothetical protein